MATTTPSPPPVFNLPNQLTALRLFLAFVLFGLIDWQNWLFCALIFGTAAFTDWLDGYLARKQGLTSTLGRNLDPLVDKVLICGAYIFLLPFGMGDGWLRPWMVTVVVARELIITSLRSYLENQGAVFGADWLGKLKMGLQCAALFAIFAYLYARTPDEVTTLAWFLGTVRDGLIWAMLGSTALSGLQYLWRAYVLFRNSREN
jgi:CDP-diacylglycerol--glycerol-3-phosphate 3-phosphatidyltransferase